MEQGKKLQRRLLLHEEVSQYIKETILTGELKPGDRIVESRLAQGLGVSQAPVREALRELEFSGLVEAFFGDLCQTGHRERDPAVL